MQKDLTDITMVVDRSGSMESIKADAEGGVNAFIDEQKNASGAALLTLVQFDNEYEFVHSGIANYSADKISGAHLAAAKKISRMRVSACAGETVDNSFTEEERDSML